jgi:APA family basic amino acid/polyamine antiporter
MVLRKLHPEMHRPFRTPAVWLVAPLGIFFCGWLMYGLPRDTWARLIVWMLIGFVIYFAYSHRHSKLHQGLGGKTKQN